MRRIAEQQRQLILAVAAEGHSNYPAAALEKDIHLTEVLRAFSEPFDSVDIQLGGGTSLVKGHHLFARMSEDLDLKLQPQVNESRSLQRKHLGTLKTEMLRRLTGRDYIVANVSAHDSNQHINIDVEYEPVFDPHFSLRPTLKIEAVVSDVFMPARESAMATLLDGALGQTESSFMFPCISIEQTTAEKTLAMLTKFHAPTAQHDSYDVRLVRHIHDIHSA